MIIPSFQDALWWWQPFALLWKKQDVLPIQHEISRIETQLTGAESVKFRKFTSALHDLQAWLESIVRDNGTSADENDALIFTYIPLTLQLQVDPLIFFQARATLAAKFPTLAPPISSPVQETQHPLPALEPVVAPPFVSEAVAAVDIAWPQVAFKSQVYNFRQHVHDSILSHGDEQLKTALLTLKSKYPHQYEGNLAVAACYLSSTDTHADTHDAALHAYFRDTPDFSVDMDALLTLGGQLCLSE